MDALDQQSMSDSYEVAQYVRVDPFNMYIAIEGKNRVSLFRKFKRSIVARVTMTSYPPAHELRLVKLRPCGVNALLYTGGRLSVTKRLHAWQAIRVDGHLGAVLPFKESVAVLQEYGVRFAGNRISLLAAVRRRKALLTVANDYYVR
ncbi:MAG TPA: hypothetical protein VFL63_05455 [Rhodanobacteraceae bacterium]|nr:hypothetical protein [Rhodanobacteraceae bacterium]